jgi:hypothetical protein
MEPAAPTGAALPYYVRQSRSAARSGVTEPVERSRRVTQGSEEATMPKPRVGLGKSPCSRPVHGDGICCADEIIAALACGTWPAARLRGVVLSAPRGRLRGRLRWTGTSEPTLLSARSASVEWSSQRSAGWPKQARPDGVCPAIPRAAMLPGWLT